MRSLGITKTGLRNIAIAALPALMLVVGAVYLVRLATGESDSGRFTGSADATAGVSSAPSAPSGAPTQSSRPSVTPPAPPHTVAPTATRSRGAVSGSTRAISTRRPPPQRVRINVGGVRLDGSVPSSDDCLTFLNTQFRMPV